MAENSATEGTRLVTGSLTKQLAEKLSEVDTDDALLQMLEENLASFSEVRERFHMSSLRGAPGVSIAWKWLRRMRISSEARRRS